MQSNLNVFSLAGSGQALSPGSSPTFTNVTVTGTLTLTSATVLPNGSTATTQSPVNNTTDIATTAYVDQMQMSGGYYYYIEEFNGGGGATVTTATTATWDHSWGINIVTGGSTGTILGTSGSIQNPGQLIMTTPATNADGLVLYQGGGTNSVGPWGIILNSTGWTADWWFLTGASIASISIRVGLSKGGNQAADAPTGGAWIETDTSNTANKGGASTHGTITGGSSYTTGTYTNVPITGGSGSGCLATVVVSGGAVTTVTFTTPGTGYLAADTGLSASAANIGGTGSGFSFGLSAVTQNWNIRTGTGSSYNYVDTGVAVAVSTQVHLRFTMSVAGTLLWQVGSANGALSSVASISTDIDTTENMASFFQVVARTSSAKTLTADRFSMVYPTGRV